MRIIPAAAVVALTIVACGGGPEADVRGDYLRFWDAYLGAKASADPDHAGLRAHAGGKLLETLRANLENARSDHVSSRGHVEHHVRSTTVRGDRAVLVDCMDLDGMVLYDLRTGDPLPNQLADRPSQLVEYTLSEQRSGWVAVENRILGEC